MTWAWLTPKTFAVLQISSIAAARWKPSPSADEARVMRIDSRTSGVLLVSLRLLSGLHRRASLTNLLLGNRHAYLSRAAARWLEFLCETQSLRGAGRSGCQARQEALAFTKRPWAIWP